MCVTRGAVLLKGKKRSGSGAKVLLRSEVRDREESV